MNPRGFSAAALGPLLYGAVAAEGMNTPGLMLKQAEEKPQPRWGRCELLTALACLAVLAGLVFCRGEKASSGVEWPGLYDAWRDVGVAQSMLDGNYPEDHVYLGETQWYNPVTGAVLALGSWLSGWTPNVVDARIGAYVDLLLPIMLFLLTLALLDPWVGLVAVAVFLFNIPTMKDPWMFATYSPWLFAPHFAQIFLYGTLLLYWQSWRTGRRAWYVVTGMFWGVTFMTHTASALLLGCITLLMTIDQLWAARKAGQDAAAMKRIAGGFLILVSVAFAISLPYTGPILWSYHFHIINTGPSLFCEASLMLSRLPRFLRDALTWSNGLAVAGMIALARAPQKRFEKRLLFFWLFACLAFLFQTYLWQVFNGVLEPEPPWLTTVRSFVPEILKPGGAAYGQLVPAHHFILGLSPLRAIFIGYGCMGFFQAFLWAVRWIRGGARWESKPLCQMLKGVFAVLMVFVIWKSAQPAYRNWGELVKTENLKIYNAQFAYSDPAYHWILEHCAPTDVFLANPGSSIALKTAAPAARKVVAVNTIFSNPYVDLTLRCSATDAMFNALHAHDEAAFRAVAAKYHVTYVLVDEEDRVSLEKDLPGFIEQVFSKGPVAIYRVRSQGVNAAARRSA